MSIKLVETAIREFLSKVDPDVLCLSGRWGVGKTFAWNRLLKEAQSEQKVALRRYAYVSLFGISSLDELKYSIFENSVRVSDIGVEPNLDTLQTNSIAVFDRLGRKGSWFLQQLPFAKNYVGGLGPVWFLSVKETIVCIDDIERRGKGLHVRDVLGLVSALKEQKKCKAVLILNDEALDDEDEFRKYYEKVVDTTVKFAPTPQESTRIAINSNTKTGKLLADNCVTLGISNIRLIKKVERHISSVETMLSGFHEQIFMQAIQSLTLFGWSIYEPNTAPQINYLLKWGTEYSGLDKNKPISEEDTKWNSLLRAYGLTGLDEFDLALLEGTRNGFFDREAIRKHASLLDERARANDLDKSFADAWGMYHDSFDNDQDVVLDAMRQAFLKGAQYISQTNMNHTIVLFKALGRPEQAAALIDHYIKTHSKNRDFFALHKYPFGDEVTDPDVVCAFKEKYATFKTAQSPKDILLSMVNMNGWNQEYITDLATTPSNDYYVIFKNSRGKELRKIINACLQFDRIGGASDEMKEISKRAKDALKQIGRESPINSRRVKAYGVDVNEETPNSELS